MPEPAKTETTAAADEKTVAPFVRFLQEHRNGRLAHELAEALNELVQAVTETTKPGTLTLAIKVKPADKGTGALMVSDNVTVKRPVAERGASVFYADDHNNLTRRDPRQPELPLVEVPRPTVQEVQLP